MAYKKKYTAEEKAEYEQQKKQDIEDMIHKIDKGVKAVFESEKYKEYLKFASKFTDYSARNTMLINIQKPESTLVAAYGKWKQLGRQVDKGQTGIAILAPVVYKTNSYIETDKPAVDEFGNQLYNEDGTKKMEKVETPITGLAFKKVYVFDVSQTSGKELPKLTTELTGDVDEERKAAVFSAVKKITGIDVEFEDIEGTAKGYYSSASQRIVIRSGMSDAQTLKTAFHETTHCLLHDPDKKIVTAKSPRNEKEVQAESVAFMVAERFGIDTSEYSFPYIASWSDGKQLEQLKNSLQEIQEAAKRISNEIESELLKMQKREFSIEEKIADTELNNVQKAEFLIDDCAERGINFSDDDKEKIIGFAESHEDISETVQLVSDMESIQKQRDSYGYDFTYMKPIDTKEEALEAFDKGEAVYLLYPDNTEGMAESREDIENFDGFFGIEKEPTETLEQDGLIVVSKETALEMWAKSVDVYINDIPAENKEQIENAPDDAKIYVVEYQYSAELDFDKAERGNTAKKQTDTPYDISIAIDKAISDNNYKLYHYDTKKAAAEVIEKYGAEKVSRVLAEYVSNHGYDGRISHENKEWARGIDIPKNNYPPAFQTHPIVLESFINETRLKIDELNRPKLPDIYNDKFLLSTERVDLRDDYRGIPETNFYNSSANEYFVEGIGWLDNAAYDWAMKNSGMTGAEFYKGVSLINAAYVDTQGKCGNMDMTKQEYDLMTEKTYSLENKEELEKAKAKLAERKDNAGILPKPVEYYAVRQDSDCRYAVCTIGTDGAVQAVKSNINSIAEAKKSMIEIFEKKKDTVRCKFIHPQTLNEKAEEIRAQKNLEKDNKPDFQIYQIKKGEAYHFIRFEPYDRLLEHGSMPDMKNYDKVYEGSYDILPTNSNQLGAKLEAVFQKFNLDRPDDFKGHSLSVSDVVIMENKAYYVNDIGFKHLPDFIIDKAKKVETDKFLSDLPARLSNTTNKKDSPKVIADEAKKYNIPLHIMREAALLVDNKKADRTLDYFENKVVKQKKQKL